MIATAPSVKRNSRPAPKTRQAAAPQPSPAPSAGDAPTVFLVDADASARQEIRELVAAMGLRCEVYASSRDFLEHYDPARPGCLVMELWIPGQVGLLPQQLQAHGVRVPMVFLASRADVAMAVEVLRSGAVHYLEKPLRSHELWMAIQEAVELDSRQREVDRLRHTLQQRLASLNDKERRVLELLGQGRSVVEIAHALDVCIRTAELYRVRVANKLSARSLADVIETGILLNWFQEQSLQVA